jgi:hypothetical protein
MITIHALNAISIDLGLHTQIPSSNSVGMLKLLVPLLSIPMKHLVCQRQLNVKSGVKIDSPAVAHDSFAGARAAAAGGAAVVLEAAA